MVSGESMYPTLKNGDTILIDISRGWQGDGIYLIRIGTDLLVKRLKKSINHQLSIISDNPTWGTETFDLRQVDDSEFAVLGKHLWHGSSAI
jgi:phage repressor protein C with HTH and peptisase S24 domain